MKEKILEQAKQHFFAAMLQGWVGGGHVLNVPNMPGQKETIYEKDDFQITDRFSSSPNKSEGMTTIRFCKNVIWSMHYEGLYRPEDIPSLKRILKAAYLRGEFLGGRGPKSCLLNESIEGVIYSNTLSQTSTFLHFSGTELIFDSGRTRGYHLYRGMTVL